MTVRRAPPLAEVASVSQRLGVLLAAGVPPPSAWQFVAESSRSPIPAAAAGADDVPRALADASAGLPRLERAGWLGLAAAWQVASDAGAPLAATLRDYATSLRSLSEAQRDAEVALAAPRATAQVVLALPAVGILFGAFMGFGTLAVLLTSPIGWGCIVMGGGLMLAARAWNRKLIAAAEPLDATPGLGCELLAIGVSGGASLDRARESSQRALERFGLPDDLSRVDEVLDLSRRAGVPAAELLRAEAEEARRDARAEAQRSAAALSVRLMLPLGVCVLPAFVVLGVVPLLVAVLSSTVGSF